MRKCCQHLVRACYNSLAYLGTDGEMALLFHEERVVIVRMAREIGTEGGRRLRLRPGLRPPPSIPTSSPPRSPAPKSARASA